MTSEKQVLANKENAKKTTAPKSKLTFMTLLDTR